MPDCPAIGQVGVGTHAKKIAGENVGVSGPDTVSRVKPAGPIRTHDNDNDNDNLASERLRQSKGRTLIEALGVNADVVIGAPDLSSAA